MKKIIYFILGLLCVYNYSSWAALSGPTSSINFADFSINFSSFLEILIKALLKISLVLGVCFFLSSLIQFKNYRDNSSQVPISRPFFLLIIGFFFVSIPFLTQLFDHSFT